MVSQLAKVVAWGDEEGLHWGRCKNHQNLKTNKGSAFQPGLHHNHLQNLKNKPMLVPHPDQLKKNTWCFFFCLFVFFASPFLSYSSTKEALRAYLCAQWEVVLRCLWCWSRSCTVASHAAIRV